MKHTSARSAKDKYVLLSELGSKYNLCFSSHLVLGNKLVALDGIKKSLLISESGNDWDQPYVIELSEVTAVSVKKSYGSIVSGELKTKGLEEFLKRIDLRFEYGDKSKPFVLTFYDSEANAPQDIPRLARSAKNWQMILSKMLASQSDSVTKKRKKLSLVD